MTFKEFILSQIQLFFFLVTLILTASAVIGGIVAPEQELRYYHLFSPIIIAGLCILPGCLTYSKKEPTVWQYIFRFILEISLIEGIVMFLVSPPSDLGISKNLFYIILGGTVLVIYLLSMLMIWYQKYSQSQKLTQQLKKFQSNS